MRQADASKRGFWIVSPNVGHQASRWRSVILQRESAFIGYKPDSKRKKRMGYKFAQIIQPNDIILIARRYHKKPDVVGCGVVVGKFKTSLNGFDPPTKFGSLRILKPFVGLSAPPPGVMKVLPYNQALCELHPNKKTHHKHLCEWMERALAQPEKVRQTLLATASEPLPQLARLPCEGLEFRTRTLANVKLAKKKEASLVRRYRAWLLAQGRELCIAKYKNLRCDAYEVERNNLLEAKASTGREHIRMAVGQLLDYSYLGRVSFGKPNLAILLPEKPDDRRLERWLSELKISLVWGTGSRFEDNTNNQFA